MRIIYALTWEAAMLAAGFCHACDGAYEINQACVDTACFSGDTAGFPVTIATPAAYRLSSDLTVSKISTGGGSQWSDAVVQLHSNLCGSSVSCP